MDKQKKSAENYRWQLITEEFFTAIEDLKLGEILRDEAFGLFEAMTAIEMMDPKMDAGLKSNRSKNISLSFEDALECGLIKLDSVPNKVINGFFDNILVGFMSWLEGDLLIQTVFTNLYLHKPHLVKNKVMKMLCFSVYKFIDVIKDIVYQANVVEDEDFQPAQNGYRLNPDVGEQKMVKQMEEIEAGLRKKIKSLKMDNNDLFGVYQRVKFVKDFYVSLVSFLDFARNCNESTIGYCQNILLQAMHALQDISSRLDSRNDDPDAKKRFGFQPAINQKLLPPTFPKYTNIRSIHDGYGYFVKLTEDLRFACNIIQCQNFDKALNFIISLNKKNPSLLLRSVLQLIFIKQGNGMYPSTRFSKILKDSVVSFCPKTSTDILYFGDVQIKVQVDVYLEDCNNYFKSLVQVFGHNRARQREKIAHILQDFGKLQEITNNFKRSIVNVSFRKFEPFTPWVAYNTLKIINVYILSGFDLELYSCHEYLYIFWYLHEYLYPWMISKLENRSDYTLEKCYYECLQKLTGGYYKAICGFTVTNKIKTPNLIHSKELIRFENRFRAVKYLQFPPKITYKDYQNMYEEMICCTDVNSFYSESSAYFSDARSMLSLLPEDKETNSLNNVAKNNYVVVKLLTSGYKNDCWPEFEFDVNNHFPNIKLI